MSGAEEGNRRRTGETSARVVHLSWHDIDELCRTTAQKIRGSGFKPDIIVGIQRGGCVPAVVLSHLLDVRDFCTLGMRSTKSEDIWASRQQPTITTDLPPYLVMGKQVLLVDDVTNTGLTISIARNRIVDLDCGEVRTAVLAWDTSNVQSCQADYYATEADGWVVFPWEKETETRDLF